MKKINLRLFLILFAVVTLISTVVFATEVTPLTEETPDTTQTTTNETGNQGTDTQTPTGQIETKDRYFAGDNIEITTLIDSNVFAIGKSVTLTGQIGGDLFVIAENVTIGEGTAIYGNLVVMSSTLTIEGQIYDVYAACDKIEVGYDGYIYRDLRVMGTEVYLNGIVGRNAYLEADKLVLNKDCVLQGNLNYTAQSDAIYIDESNNESTTIPDKVIEGENNYTPRSKKLFKNEIKKSVNSILKTNKINGDISEDKVKEIIISNIFNISNINTNSEIAKEGLNKVLIPTMYIYIDIIVIIALILGIVLPKVIGKKDKTKKEDKE